MSALPPKADIVAGRLFRPFCANNCRDPLLTIAAGTRETVQLLSPISVKGAQNSG
jgi:hypothetical protein